MFSESGPKSVPEKHLKAHPQNSIQRPTWRFSAVVAAVAFWYPLRDKPADKTAENTIPEKVLGNRENASRQKERQMKVLRPIAGESRHCGVYP